MKKRWALVAALCLFLLPGCSQEEKNFPSRPVQLIVPYAAGGAADQTARALAASSKDALGQPINVVNKADEKGPAAGLAAGAAAKADGYTVTLVTADLAILPLLGQNQTTYKQFEAFLCLNEDPVVLAVRTDSPWQTTQAFVTYAAANSGQLRVGNAGAGTIWHMAALVLEKKAGVAFAHRNFAGAAPAIASLLNREIEAVAVSQAEAVNQAAAGRLRILGVMSERSSAVLPGVPTMRQQGYDLTLATWRGLAVPKGTPAATVQKLLQAFQQGAQAPSFSQYMAKAGIETRYLAGTDFEASIQQQERLFRNLLSESGASKE